MSARNQASSSTQPHQQHDGSEPPRFLKAVRRVAASAPGGTQRHFANGLVQEFIEEYEAGLAKIEALNSNTAKPGVGTSPDDIVDSIMSFSCSTNTLDNLCKSVGIPFFDEQWIFTYWMPMMRLVKSHCKRETSVPMKALASMFMKSDMALFSLECKTEILKLLVELLEGMKLNPMRLNDIVNICWKTLVDERPDRMQNRATRRATAHLIMQSGIIRPFLKVVSEPLKMEIDLHVRHEAKTDIAFLLGLVFTSLLGEMDPKVAEQHAPEFEIEIDNVSSNLWEELGLLAASRARALEDDPDPAVALENYIRLEGVFVCYQCLAVLSDEIIDDSYMDDVEGMAYSISEYVHRDENLEEDAQVHQDAVGIAQDILEESVPLSDKTREWFANKADEIARYVPDIYRESQKRAKLDDFVGFNMFPMDKPPRPEDYTKAFLQKIRDNQVVRGLLTKDNKIAVREPASSGMSGTNCACCNVEGVSGSNLKMMRCGRCFSVSYCSKECQKLHWKVHKKVCKAKEQE